jgi:MFS-type transporter involved in bile tolerance (Atg22 family)
LPSRAIAKSFGAVVVRDGEVVARGVNEIHTTNDPTAHEEMTAIRAASRKLGSPDLGGCTVYASGHPCPMCMAAMLLGAGLGGCFAISMIVALDHLADPAEAGALSALMQGGGFLITALPPWIVAMLHDLTGSFMAGWGSMSVIPTTMQRS